jgi:uncharacterized ferritin-like protein (DUF455 family)
MTDQGLLQANDERGRLMRKDTAELLSRIFFAQRSLVIGQAGWVASLERIEEKSAQARILWEDSLAAGDVRDRILELRYPRRDINPEHHQAVIALFGEARNAPSAGAWLLALARTLKPALIAAYEHLDRLSDRVSDGPTHLLMRHALADLREQVPELTGLAAARFESHPEERDAAEAWAAGVQERLSAMGHSLLDATVSAPASEQGIDGRQSFEIPSVPGRDPRFRRVRFYWPHIIDTGYPSDTGVYLQLRSAIGHINEAWASEIVAVTLYTFADQLEWDFIADLARWTYDESRHCLMGYKRLLAWGFKPEDIPLGDYIYRAARADDAIYGLGLLHYFETKYIHRTKDRIQTFADYHDTLSQHDYEFDWADETHHAGYGRRWLEALLAGREKDRPLTLEGVLERCGQLVDETVATATEAEREELLAFAANLMQQADDRIARSPDLAP